MAASAQKVLEENSTFSSAISEANNYNNWIIDEFEPYLGTSAAEIGIGHGNFCTFLKARGVTTYVGIDIDKSLVQHANKEHPENRYFEADICEKDLPDRVNEKFNSVLCANVIEHIENDSAAIENMLMLLKPGGHLLLFTPAFQGLYSDMDKLAGHYRRYTKKTLWDAVPPSHKKKIIRNEYFNPIGGLGWYVNKFKTHTSLEDDAINTQIRFFDKYVLPISRIINPITKSFFGQSSLMIIKK